MDYLQSKFGDAGTADPTAVCGIDAFLAASCKFADGAAPNSLFNELRARPDTGFQHVKVYDFPAGAAFPFQGRPASLNGVMALPIETSELLQREILDQMQPGRRFAIEGGSGTGKSFLLSAIAGKVYASRPGCDIYCHEDSSGQVTAILRSDDALKGAPLAKGQTHVVKRIALRTLYTTSVKRLEHDALLAAFPTFNSPSSVYLYDHDHTREQRYGNVDAPGPFPCAGVTIATGCLDALPSTYKNQAHSVPIVDPSPEVFVEQAAAVLGPRKFSLAKAALSATMWGTSLRPLVQGGSSWSAGGFAAAVMKSWGAIMKGESLSAEKFAKTRNLFVGLAPSASNKMRTLVLDSDITDYRVLVGLLCNDRESIKAAVVAARASQYRDDSSASQSTQAVLGRIGGLIGLDAAARDKSVSREAFVEQWRALLPVEHISPPAFLTHPPAWATRAEK